jgi:membrane associated rhomboid family serine protease
MMTRFKNTGIFSKIFIFAISIIYLLNYVYFNFLPNFLSLQPSEIIQNFALWKLISFPLTPGSTEAFYLFVLTFYFIASKLEMIVDNFRFPIWLFILTLLQGCVLTLVFWNSHFVIAGLEGISFFILTLYSLLKPKSQLKIMRSNISVIAFTVILTLIWAVFKFSFSIYHGSYTIIPSLSSAVFGISIGLMVYLQVRFTKISRRSYEQIDEKDLMSITPNELLATVRDKKKGGFLYNTEKIGHDNLDEFYANDKYYYLSENAEENEERLNEILDKIGSSGKESLSPSENKFLEIYSKQL